MNIYGSEGLSRHQDFVPWIMIKKNRLRLFLYVCVVLESINKYQTRNLHIEDEKIRRRNTCMLPAMLFGYAKG
jgi:hypothetical protein